MAPPVLGVVERQALVRHHPPVVRRHPVVAPDADAGHWIVANHARRHRAVAAARPEVTDPRIRSRGSHDAPEGADCARRGDQQQHDHRDAGEKRGRLARAVFRAPARTQQFVDEQHRAERSAHERGARSRHPRPRPVDRQRGGLCRPRVTPAQVRNRDERNRPGKRGDGPVRVRVEQRARGAAKARPGAAAQEGDVHRALVDGHEARQRCADPQAVDGFQAGIRDRGSGIRRFELSEQPIDPHERHQLRDDDIQHPAFDLWRRQQRPRIERAVVAERPEPNAGLPHDHHGPPERQREAPDAEQQSPGGGERPAIERDARQQRREQARQQGGVEDIEGGHMQGQRQ